MLTRKEFIILLLISIAGAGFSYVLAGSLPYLYEWLKFSVMAVVMTVALIVIAFGVFLVWCCAKYGQYQAYKERKLYEETNDNYKDHW